MGATGGPAAKPGRSVARKAPPIVELRPAAGAAPASSCFELELVGGRRVRVPSTFDSAALKRLLTVLETP